MYEQFTVVTASTILGVAGGLFLSIVVTSSFFNLIELHFKMLVPTELTVIVIIIGFATTFMATYTPITKLNKSNISRALIG